MPGLAVRGDDFSTLFARHAAMLPGATRCSAQAGIEPVQRLYRASVDPYLEVQVVAGRRAGGTDPADQVPLVHRLPEVHQDRRLVPVAGGQPPALVDARVEAAVVAGAAGP